MVCGALLLSMRNPSSLVPLSMRCSRIEGGVLACGMQSGAAESATHNTRDSLTAHGQHARHAHDQSTRAGARSCSHRPGDSCGLARPHPVWEPPTGTRERRAAKQSTSSAERRNSSIGSRLTKEAAAPGKAAGTPRCLAGRPLKAPPARRMASWACPQSLRASARSPACRGPTKVSSRERGGAPARTPETSTGAQQRECVCAKRLRASSDARSRALARDFGPEQTPSGVVGPAFLPAGWQRAWQRAASAMQPRTASSRLCPCSAALATGAALRMCAHTARRAREAARAGARAP